MTLVELSRYELPHSGTYLAVAGGSVVDFQGDAIVNAANEGCVAGGGVDGAVSRAGGQNLLIDRYKLPVVSRRYGLAVRCNVGSAVVTGPNDYNKLPPYVIHAVGPNLREYPDAKTGMMLLKSAYMQSLDIANSLKIQRVAFSLLSAGVFRGRFPLHTVLQAAVEAIREWVYDNKPPKGFIYVNEIYLCAFSPNECNTLKDICDHILPCCPDG